MRISLLEAARLLDSGHVVAVPTETVYGLAGSLKHPEAVDEIFSLKGRPSNNPLIIHVGDVDQIASFVSIFPEGFQQLATAFWPGPMTLVLPLKEGTVPGKVRANLPTAAFRIPSHPLALRLLAVSGPLVMPSANLSGSPSATSPEHVEIDFGFSFPVLDGGACSKGLESTILIEQEGQWRIIRQGSLPPEAFETALGYRPQVVVADSKAPICPGQLYRHYAPKAALKLASNFTVDMKGVVLGYEGRDYPSTLRLIPLGTLQDPDGVAESLYRVLRDLDANGIVEAWVDVGIPDTHLWSTILERLTKAAQSKQA